MERYLLGDEQFHGFLGLIDRVRERVDEISADPGPQYKTGSVSGVTDHKTHSSSADEAHVFNLYLGVRQWLSLSCDPTEEARWLARHRQSDVERLIQRRGLLSQVRDSVERLLAEGSEQAVDKIHDLIGILLDWLDGHCTHSLQEMDAPDGITVLVCRDCDVRVSSDRRGRWTAV